MSWSFNHIGTRQAVADQVRKENYVPEALKQAIVDVILLPKPSSNGVHVSSHGHVDQSSGTCEVKIETYNLLLDPAPVVPAASEYEAPKAAPQPSEVLKNP